MSEHGRTPVVGQDDVGVAASGRSPSGTVTFLFTDIEGSTGLWESASPRMAEALALHDAIVRSAVAGHGGRIFATGGDGFAVAFSRASDAVAAAAEAQRALASAEWPDGIPLRVRMGLHTGEAFERGGDYFGPSVNRSARLMAIAHGGQIVCSAVTAGLVTPAVALVDLGEHRLRDLSSPQRVFQVGTEEFPSLRSPDVVPTNLPVALTELVGRVAEVEELAADLRGHRLVTLTGVGGVGKTRLAMTVAAEAAPAFPDGCWFVELAAVASPAGVPQAIAAVLGAPVGDAGAIAAAVADRRLLLVLDNCEHLLDEVADAIEVILAAGSEPVILTTSREPLGIPGELVFRVRSLETPGADAELGEALESDAVRLFVDRARAAGGFELHDGNVQSVAKICQRLDGIPLGIELAAAHASAMPVEEILRRLDERFRLLAASSRRAQDRHRTLQATVQWSYDLLAPSEQTVFRRMAVFPASFDVAAAEAVAAAEDVDVLQSLVSLVRRSMVVFEAATGRYSLLETLRQFGADRLTEAGEAELVRQRHVEYYATLARELAGQMHDDRFPSASRRFVVEEDNLRAVASWLQEEHRWQELFGLCNGLYVFMAAGDTDWFDPYLKSAEHLGDLSDTARADGLSRVAYTAYFRGDPRFEALASDAENFISSRRVSGCGWEVAAMRGVHHLAMGDPVASLAAFERSAAIARQVSHPGAEVLAALTATALWEMGRVDEARERALAGLELVRRGVGGAAAAWFSTGALGLFAYSGEVEDAELALDLLRDLEPLMSLAPLYECARNLFRGAALITTGQPGAGDSLVRAIQIADRRHFPRIIDFAARLLAIVQGEAGEVEVAARLAGFADAHESRGFLAQMHQRWSKPWVQRIVASLPDDVRTRAVNEGARLTRRQLLNLVTRLENP